MRRRDFDGQHPNKIVNFLYRLFYFHQDAMLKYIREESFFNCLLWIHVTLSGMIVSVLLGENVHNFNEFHTSFIFYGFCSKKYISWEESTWSYIMLIASRFVIVLFTSGAQIALFKKHSELEKQRAEGIMVTIYSKDGVTISRRAHTAPVADTG